MEILFLGTSSGWPLPRLGCDCEICTSSDPKDKRLRPSILINNQILVDAPFDIYHQLLSYKINPRKLTHIILTHGHLDHVVGLYDLSHIYNLDGKIKVVGTAKTLVSARKFMGPGKRLEPTEMAPSEIELLPVYHGSVETSAIKIKEVAETVVYAPEFRSIPASSQRQIKKADLLIIDGSSKTSLGRAAGHETMEEGLILAKKLLAKKILFTNIGHKTGTHKELEKKFALAFDGLRVVI